MYSIAQKCLKRFMIRRKATAKADVSGFMVMANIKKIVKECKQGDGGGAGMRKGIPPMLYQQPLRSPFASCELKSGMV